MNQTISVISVSLNSMWI